MSKELELGQIAFGNPTGDYGTEEFADALIEYLLCEIERVYFNINQFTWDRVFDPELKGVTFNSYCWNDDEKQAAKPNLKFKGLEQEIRWYKYPGRGQTSTLKFSEKQWRDWFERGLRIIRKNEPK